MSTPLLQLYPLSGDLERTQVIKDMLEMTKSGEHTAVVEIVAMLEDLHLNGPRSKHQKKLKGIPLFELKPHSRGGQRGGARVYFAYDEHGNALIANAEVKADESSANPHKIAQALRMLGAYRSNRLQAALNTKSRRR